MWFLVAAVAADTAADSTVVLLVSAALVASLVRVPSIGDLSSAFQQVEVQVAAATAPWTLAVVIASFDIDDRVDVGWASLAVAAVVVAVAVAVPGLIHRAHFVSLLLGASVVTTIGVATLLSTDAMLIVMAVHAAGLVVVARSLGNSLRIYVNAALLGLVAGLAVVVRMSAAWTTDAPIGDDLAHLAVIVALAIGLWETRLRVVRSVGAVAVLALLLLWLGSVLKHLPQGQAIVSISWALVGTAVLVVGVVRKVPEFGTVGLAVLALTVAKLLSIDLQEVDTLWRAGLFLLIGLGLMRLGFLLPKLTARAARADDAGAGPDVSGSRRASG